MVEINPDKSVPHPHSPSGPQSPNPHVSGKGSYKAMTQPADETGPIQPGWGKFQKFLKTKKNFKKFQQQLEQSIVHQIGQEKQRAKKASEQLRRAEEGKDLYDGS